MPNPIALHMPPCPQVTAFIDTGRHRSYLQVNGKLYEQVPEELEDMVETVQAKGLTILQMIREGRE